MNTCMTLLCHHPARNRNDSVSGLVRFVGRRAMLKVMRFLSIDADVTPVALHYPIDENCAAVFRNRYRPGG